MNLTAKIRVNPDKAKALGYTPWGCTVGVAFRADSLDDPNIMGGGQNCQYHGSWGATPTPVGHKTGIAVDGGVPKPVQLTPDQTHVMVLLVDGAAVDNQIISGHVAP